MLALCSGKQIPGFEPPPRPQQVWLINFEDNRNAMAKRIAAAMKHYGLKYADFGDRLHVAAKGEFIATLAKQIRNGTVERNEPLIQEIVRSYCWRKKLTCSALTRSSTATASMKMTTSQSVKWWSATAL